MFHQLLPATFDTMYAGHSRTDSGSPAQMTPGFAEGCCGYQCSSRTFQQLSGLRLPLLQTRDPHVH